MERTLFNQRGEQPRGSKAVEKTILNIHSNSENVEKQEEVSQVRLLQSFDNGGCISAEYDKRTNEENENIKALTPLAAMGKKIILKATSKKTGVRSADSFVDGELLEVKTNHTPTVSAIDNAIRSCNGQAKNLLINIESNISQETLEKGIKGRIFRTNIEKIIIVKNGKIERTYYRNMIEK